MAGEEGDHEPTPGSSDTILGVDPLGHFAAPVRACGAERWAVKTAADADVTKIQISNPQPTTVAIISAIPPPGALPPTRLLPAETNVWIVHGQLVKAKIEADHDVHLVLTDGGLSMIAEVPDPACLAPSNPLLPAIRSARDLLTSHYALSPQVWTPINQPVTITGVEFFDKLHGQTGVARNGVELHPVTGLVFG